MTLQQIDKRLSVIESASAAEMVTCSTCAAWPSILIRFQDVQGAILKYVNDSNSWPLDTATCPGCGRQPEVNVIQGSRLDDPQ